MYEHGDQFNHLCFSFDLDEQPFGEDSADDPFEEDDAIEQANDQEYADTEELEDSGSRYIADIEPIARLVELIKKWYRGWEKFFPPMERTL